MPISTLSLGLTLNILIATESFLSPTVVSSVFHVLGCTAHMSSVEAVSVVFPISSCIVCLLPLDVGTILLS